MFALRVLCLSIAFGTCFAGGALELFQPIKIPFDQVNFTIFNEKSSTFESKIYASLQTTKNFFALPEVQTTIKAGSVIAGVFLGPLTGLVPVITNVLGEESDWKKSFTKVIGDETDRAITLNNINWMESTLNTIEKKLSLLNDTNPDMDNRKTIASIFHTYFDEMINYFDRHDSLFKKYPLLGSPPLIQLALLISVFNPIALKLNPLETRTPQLACEIRDVLVDYRDRAIEERLHKVRTDDEYSVPHFLKYKAKLRTGAAVDKWLSLQCAKSCSLNVQVCTQDEFSSTIYREDVPISLESTITSTACMDSYSGLVKRRTEQMFPVDLLSSLCDEQPKTPTGKGWLTIKIRDIHAYGETDGSSCESNPVDPCDSYVRLFVNGEQVAQSGIKEDTSSYDANISYTSGLISKSSTIKIEVWDDDSIIAIGSNADLIQSVEGDIQSFLNEPFKLGRTISHFGKQNSIETACFWADQTE